MDDIKCMLSFSRSTRTALCLPLGFRTPLPAVVYQSMTCVRLKAWDVGATDSGGFNLEAMRRAE